MTIVIEAPALSWLDGRLAPSCFPQILPAVIFSICPRLLPFRYCFAALTMRKKDPQKEANLADEKGKFRALAGIDKVTFEHALIIFTDNVEEYHAYELMVVRASANAGKVALVYCPSNSVSSAACTTSWHHNRQVSLWSGKSMAQPHVREAKNEFRGIRTPAN